MPYILFSTDMDVPLARIDAAPSTATLDAGQMAIPCAHDADPSDVAYWREVAANPGLWSLEAVKADKLAALNTAFEAVQRDGHLLSSLGFSIDANETANRNVVGLITGMEATGQTATYFCDYDNVMREVTLEDLRTLLLEIINYGQRLYARKWLLRETITTALDVAALGAITISFEDV